MRFCIVGTGRSGTTLLQKMMSLHPDVYVFPETHWIPKMYEFFGLAEAPTAALVELVRRTHHVTGKPTTEIDQRRLEAATSGIPFITVRDFCDIVGQLFAEAQGKRFWADKTPDYGYCMTSLQALWPECRFIHMVRHGALVAGSMSMHPGFKAVAAAGEANWGALALDYPCDAMHFDPIPMEKFVELWRMRLVRIVDESTRLRRGCYLETRLEDLLGDPANVLSRLASFVGLGASGAWLDAAKALIQPGRGTWKADPRILELFGERERHWLYFYGYEQGGNPS